MSFFVIACCQTSTFYLTPIQSWYLHLYLLYELVYYTSGSTSFNGFGPIRKVWVIQGIISKIWVPLLNWSISYLLSLNSWCFIPPQSHHWRVICLWPAFVAYLRVSELSRTGKAMLGVCSSIDLFLGPTIKKLYYFHAVRVSQQEGLWIFLILH